MSRKTDIRLDPEQEIRTALAVYYTLTLGDHGHVAVLPTSLATAKRIDAIMLAYRKKATQ